VLLWARWHSEVHSLRALVLTVGSPLLVVPNDVTFLAVVAPLSLALLCHQPRGSMGLLALLALLVSGVAICVFRSRTAVLTMGASLTCAAALMQPHRRLTRGVIYGLAFLLGILLLDGLLGFPLITKIVRKWSTLGRIGYWTTAWSMFREGPWLGLGPHTFRLFHRTPWAHNLYLEVLAEQGLVGLTALGGLLGCGLAAAWRLRHAATRERRLFGAGALAALVGLCLAGVVELSLLRLWVVLTLFTLLGVIAHLSSSSDTAKGDRV
jgi:O-antigen ligase